MSNFDNEVMKVVAKSVLSKVDIDKIVTKALPKIEAAISKDLADCIGENFYDALADTDFVYKMAKDISEEVIVKLGLEKKNAVQKRKAT